MLRRFLKTWEDQGNTRAQYSQKSQSFNGQDPAVVTLALSRRLIAVVKVKNIVNIEAGLEMIALAMAISAEVCNFDFFEKLCFIFFTSEWWGVPGNGCRYQRPLKEVRIYFISILVD